jgi:hypothetical protein
MEDSTDAPAGSYEVGGIIYGDGNACALLAPPPEATAQYELKYSSLQMVEGLYVPSHRPAFSYQRIGEIPTDPKTTQQVFEQYRQFMMQYCSTGTAQNPGTVLKQSLMALGVFGYPSRAVAGNEDYCRIFEEFQRVLRILLPRSIGFQELRIQVPDIVLVTDTGSFSLDAASGGIGALFGIAWQVLMYGIDKQGFVVTLDEPELHLHPSMQRELLPNLFVAFPNTQFIVATHSPFVATSMPEAKVYALAFNGEGHVQSNRLEDVDLSGTANQTLREILGVPISVPVWVEQRFAEITSKYRAHDLTRETLVALKGDLVAAGLGFMLPDAIDEMREGGPCAERPQD